jgi:anti-sigma factor RsiW
VDLLMVEEEKFFAWLDGELSPDEAARVEAEVSADPELSKLAAEHRAMAAGLRNAFGTVEAQPIPAGLGRLLDPEDKIVSLAEVRNAREARRVQPLWVQAAALAATLALGVFVGSQLGGQGSPIRPQDGKLVAAASLNQALSTKRDLQNLRG